MNNKTYEKQLEIEVKAVFEKKNQKLETTLKAKLTTDHFNFKAIAEFEQDRAKIDRFLKKMIKQGNQFEMSICVAEYNTDEQWNSTQLSFNYWKFNGVADYTEKDEEMGVYLSADTRYTPAEHDLWYNFTLESLSSIN